ncbi:adenosylcobinamide amidohydrolase [Cohnella cellulosilytica]|uniref:Adenosylcobinamide amidohydrolase n=1 Tax=Cohnella cellulosilytica TaxID=986710 RepID=A0ABW2F308_9BACL
MTTQPFRRGAASYASPLWPELSIRYETDHISIACGRSYETLSNAPYRGGPGSGERFVNWKVPLNYDCADPAAMMHEALIRWGYDPAKAVGLQTAAHLTHAAFAEEAGDECRLLVCASAGTGNAARAGLARETFSAYEPGTVNLIVLVDGKMTESARVNAVITATEAKSAAFADLDVRDRSLGRTATGTSTDAVLVAVSQSERSRYVHRYAGAATTIGNAIGRLVYAAVHEAVRTQGEP